MANEEDANRPPDGSKSVAPVLDAMQPMNKLAKESMKKAEEPPPVPYFQQRKQAVQEAMEMAKQVNPIAPGFPPPGMLPENPLKVFPLSHATQLLSFAKKHWDDSTANEYIQYLQAAHEEFVRKKETETETESPPAQLPEEQVRTVAFE
jgi:hypothetical protein|tara:strand:- start:199 stop:645 length:447 start_codon:yes stop_codon:yes gene_type:complete